MKSWTLLLASVATLTLAASTVWAEDPVAGVVGPPVEPTPSALQDDDIDLGMGLGLPESTGEIAEASPAGPAEALPDTAMGEGESGDPDVRQVDEFESLVPEPLAELDEPHTDAPSVDDGSLQADAVGADGESLQAEAASVDEALAAEDTTEFMPSDEEGPMADGLEDTNEAAAMGPAVDPSGEPGPVAVETRAARTVELGPMAVDADGVVGRIHTVKSGDTLWDISAAYLGTPWVWPSVWKDNGEISNPHVIEPGNRIWVTAGEMRMLTDQQAEGMIAAHPGEMGLDGPIELEDTEELVMDDMPASLGDEDELMGAAAPASMDELPVALPLETPAGRSTGAMVRISEAESLGFVASDAIDAAATLIDSPVPRTWLVGGDDIYIGLGEGEVEAGDQFTIFRDFDEVRDLDGSLLGYHVEVLGWARVEVVEAESSRAEIRMSQSEIRRGDRVVRRDPVNISVPVTVSPDAVPGNIVYMPDSRTVMGDGEWVYLNRGGLHGLEPGTEIEVYESGRMLRDKVKRARVLTPDNVVAQLIVVDVQPDSAVAYIVQTRRSLSVGDRVRPRVPRVASR